MYPLYNRILSDTAELLLDNNSNTYPLPSGKDSCVIKYVSGKKLPIIFCTMLRHSLFDVYFIISLFLLNGERPACAGLSAVASFFAA